MPKVSWKGAEPVRCAACLLLTSGESIRAEAGSVTWLDALTSVLGDSLLGWQRVGEARELDGALTREARQRPPDLLVLIEQRNWSSALREARESYGDLPILAVGSAAAEEPLTLDAGADGFCELPLDGRVLEARVRALLRRHLGRLRPPSGDALELDGGTRILRAAETYVQLSPREYDFVLRLYEQRERWVPRAALLAALSHNQAVYDSSLLRTHTLNVRTKLGARRWMLQAARGRGMMLTANEIYRAPQRGS